METLIPDFKAEEENIQRIIDAAPDVVSHNIETVERLTRSCKNTGQILAQHGNFTFFEERRHAH